MPAKRPGKKPERKPYGQETPKPTWTGGEVEKRVAENKGLIWGFAEKNPWVSMFLSREEIEREGNFVLLRAAIKYNPERGAFSTLVFTALTHHFTDVIKKNQKHKAVSLDSTKEEGEEPLKARIEGKAAAPVSDEFLRQKILQALDKLRMPTPRTKNKRGINQAEKEIILESFGIGREPLPDKDIATKHKITVTRVHAIQQNVFGNLARQFPELRKYL